MSPRPRYLFGYRGESAFDLNSEPLDPSTLPAIPRPLNSRAKKRSWAEAPVRLWLILAILVTGVTAYLYYSRIQISMADRKLIFDGTKYDAAVLEIEGQTRPGLRFPKSSSPRVKLRFTTPDNQTQTVEGNLMPAIDGDVQVGGTVPIRVNPQNPLIWTDRTEPRPLAAELSMALIFTPIALLNIFIVIFQRQRVLKIWRNGEPAIAHVVGLQHSPLAPKSMQVRYALSEGDDLRVCTMLYPASAGLPQVDEEMLLLIGNNNPAKAIVAKLYTA